MLHLFSFLKRIIKTKRILDLKVIFIDYNQYFTYHEMHSNLNRLDIKTITFKKIHSCIHTIIFEGDTRERTIGLV